MEPRSQAGEATPNAPSRADGFEVPRLELPPAPRLTRGRAAAVGHAVSPPAPPALHPGHRHVVPTPSPAMAAPPYHPPAPEHAHAHSHGHEHAHAHAHAHRSGGCEGSHGLLDGHHHDWTHLAMAPASRRMLKLALLVQATFLALEVAGGIITNSLALLGDAAHMLADVGALGLALLAAHLATRPIDARRTWGMPRVEVLAAAINSATLVLSCGWIAWEAIHRLLSPERVDAPVLIAIAVAGLGANLLGAWLLGRADRDNLNIRAAMAHLLVDAASSVGVILAGIVIALGGPVLVDTLASLLIAVVAVRGTWPVLRAALDSLLDAAPTDVSATEVARVLGAAPGVSQVHDVHVWEPGPRRIAATAHVLVVPGVEIGAAILDLRGLLARELGIGHVTLQVATDRRTQRHEIERTLPRDAAIERAVQVIAAVRPSLDPQLVRRTVHARAAHVDASAPSSAVRLVAGALRDLDS